MTMPLLTQFRKLLPLATCLVLAVAQAAEPVVLVIGHATMPRLDAQQVQRLFTGRSVDVGGVAATPVNLPPGNPSRQRFLVTLLQQDDEQYRAYWTVRRHVGKGVPPRELASAAELLAFVQATPGALGYLDAAEVKPGINVVFKP